MFLNVYFQNTELKRINDIQQQNLRLIVVGYLNLLISNCDVLRYYRRHILWGTDSEQPRWPGSDSVLTIEGSWYLFIFLHSFTSSHMYITANIHGYFQYQKVPRKDFIHGKSFSKVATQFHSYIHIYDTCFLHFFPSRSKMFILQFTADLSNLVLHNEWDVVSMKAIRNVLYYNCCPDPYPDITFSLEIKRKPLFYIMSILFPCILTSWVAALGFALPPESGEKVSLEVTVLLSLAVFLLMVTEQLPASSVNFPYVGKFCSNLDMKQVTFVCLLVYSRRNNFSAVRQLPHMLVLNTYRLFYVSHLLRHGTSIYTVSSEGSVPTYHSGIRTPDARIIRSLRPTL
jgi:hypothetical protein